VPVRGSTNRYEATNLYGKGSSCFSVGKEGGAMEAQKGEIVFWRMSGVVMDTLDNSTKCTVACTVAELSEFEVWHRN